MAAAIRVEHVAGLSVGEFGHAVITLLTRHAGNNATVVDSVIRAFEARPDAVVLAAWRPVSALCEEADELAHAAGIPWMPVIMEHPTIWVGPLIVPGVSPCYRCYRGRRVQHDIYSSTTRILEEAYQRDEDCGPLGYLQHHARTAAGIAARMLGLDGTDARSFGRVTLLRTLDWSTTDAQVVAAHSCTRCSSSLPDRDLVSVLRLGPTAGNGERP